MMNKNYICPVCEEHKVNLNSPYQCDCCGEKYCSEECKVDITNYINDMYICHPCSDSIEVLNSDEDDDHMEAIVIDPSQEELDELLGDDFDSDEYDDEDLYPHINVDGIQNMYVSGDSDNVSDEDYNPEYDTEHDTETDDSYDSDEENVYFIME